MCSKAFLAFLFILFYGLICGHASAQSSHGYVLSPRVEDEIDRAERDYFGLFPSIEGFLSARGNQILPGGISFSIRRTGGSAVSDTVIHIGGDTLAALKEYLEQYEFLFGYNYQFPRIALIMGHVHPGYIQNDVPPVTVETREGETISGRLLFVGDSSLAIWRNNEGPYHWRRVDDSDTLVILHVSQIEWLRQEGTSWIGIAGSLVAGAAAGVGFSRIEDARTADNYLIGIGIATLGLGIATADVADIRIGGNAEVLRLQQGVLRKREMFSGERPPELVRTIARTEGDTKFRSARSPITTEDLESEALPVGRIHLYTGRYWGTPLAKNQSLVVDLSAYHNPGVSGTASLGMGSWEFGIEYGISRRLRLGALYALAYEPDRGDDRINEYVRGNSIGVTGSFVVMASNPLRSNPLELTAGGGVLLYNISYLAIRNSLLDTLYEGEKSLVGLMLNTRLGYYATRQYSLWLGLQGRLFPSFSVPRGGRIRMLDEFLVEHDINPSSIGLTFGAQLYF